jgi:hypothetical protein
MILDDLRQQAHTQANVAVGSRLAAAIGANPQLRERQRVQVAPGASTLGDRVRYARRRLAVAADPGSAVTMDNVHEHLFVIPGGPILQRITESCRDGSTLSDILNQIVGSRHGNEADMKDFMGHLLRLGFLVLPDFQMDLHAPSPLKRFAEVLWAAGGSMRVAANAVRSYLKSVEEYAISPPRDRGGVLRAARSYVEQAFDAVGASRSLVPGTVLYEDCTISSRQIRLDRSVSEILERSLAGIADISPAFDMNMPRRIAAIGFFTARYGVGGQCEDFEQFCHEYQRDFFGPYTERLIAKPSVDPSNSFTPLENWFKQPEFDELDAARATVGQMVSESLASAGEEAREVRLPEDFFDRVASLMPRCARFRSSWSHFVQAIVEGGQRPMWVVNQSHSGATAMFSRFLHALDESGADATALVRSMLAETAPPDTVYAELRGGLDTTNLNLHPIVTTHEIICPGDVSRRPLDEQISLSDLFVCHRPRSDTLELRSRRLGSRVVPVYLGFLLPMALPEIQQVLLCFSPLGSAQFDYWAGTGQPLGDRDVVRYPRLVHGSLVLQRELWKVASRAFPKQGHRESDACHALRVEQWRLGQGMPNLVFAQIDREGRAALDGEEESAPQSDSFGVGRKPLPIDFQSRFCVELLDRLAREADRRLVLTEALPTPEQALVRDSSGQEWVSELLIEIYPTGRSVDVR